VYRGSFTDEKSPSSRYLSVASNPLYSGCSSFSGRRGSSVSVLSERRSSLTAYLAGRRSSDVSITSDIKLSSCHNTDDAAASPFVPKREVMFSPIHEEESEFEVEITDQQENTAQKQSLKIDHMSMKETDTLRSEPCLELLEEPSFPKLVAYKTTAV